MGGKIKKFKFLLSSNGWEYACPITVKAKKCDVVWDCDDWHKKYWLENNENFDENNEGNALMCDGVLITFDEPLETVGE